MNVYEAAVKRRTIRRFTRQAVPREVLAAAADAARLSPTGINRQPMRFAIVSEADLCAKVFAHTRWAKRIPDGSAGPDEATQPAAYIILLLDKRVMKSSDNDAAAAAMSVMLVAESMGVSSCWLANVDREDILGVLGLDSERYALHTVVALGYAAMGAKAVAMQGDETDYYLESPDMLCVPKRAREDVELWYE